MTMHTAATRAMTMTTTTTMITPPRLQAPKITFSYV